MRQTMRVVALAALAMLGLAAPAGAAIKYVHPSPGAGSTWANASNSGTPCSMDTANARATAGDTIRIYGGTYTTAPNPTNQGTGYAAMITYRGFAANYDSVYINTTGGLRCSDAFVRVECMTFGSTFWNDALSNCTGSIYVDADYRLGLTRIVADSVVFQNGLNFYGNHNKFTNCKIRAAGTDQGLQIANYNWAGNWCGSGTDTMYTSYTASVPDSTGRNYKWCAFDTLAACSISVSGPQTATDQKTVDLHYLYKLVWEDNVVAVIPSATDSAETNRQFAFAFYSVSFSKFTRSKFDMVSQRKSGVSSDCYAFLFRDGCEQNTWTQCTLSVVNRRGATFYIAHGSGTCDQRSQNNVFDRCLFRSVRSAERSFLGSIGTGNATSGFGYSRIQGCVFIDSLLPFNDNNNGLSNPGHTAYPDYPNYGHTRQPTTVRNNTFIVWSGTNAVGYEVPDTTNKDTAARVRFYNNIIYAPNSTTAMTWSLARVPQSVWYTTQVDTVDNNIYWTGSTAENPISYRDASGTTNESSTNQAGTWRDTYGNDANSKEVSPLFADSSWATLWSGNVALAAGSAAIDAGINGGEENIGAWNLDATGPEVTLNSPNGGESWEVGSAHDIDVTYAANGGSGMAYAILEYNANGGSGSWTGIRTYIPDDDAFVYSWTTPGTPDTDYRVRVKIKLNDSTFVSDSSAANFTLSGDITIPDITCGSVVGAPSGLINAGGNHDIQWTATDNVGVDHIAIRLDEDGGWGRDILITASTENDGSYTYNWPLTGTWQVAISAYDAAGNKDSCYVDPNNDAFTVIDSLPPNKVRNLWADWVGWTAVRLRWTGVANCTTTVVKYDTLPFAESGANNFRTHGTSVSTGTPAAAGVGDSLTVTGLTPGTRYYFGLAHIDNDATASPVGGVDSPETSLVSIGECRTTRPAVLKGLHARSTRPYPLVMSMGRSLWESVIEDSFPRNIAGWPIYPDMATATPVRDSTANQFYGSAGLYTAIGVGTGKTSSSTLLGTKARPGAWGQVDSVYKSKVSDGIVVSHTPGNLWNIYKQYSANQDTTGLGADNPWEWDEFINWFVARGDTAGTMAKDTRPSGYIYPEKLFLWSSKQAGTRDTCTFGAWYANPGTPLGMTSSTPQRLNILYRDTTTGELLVVEKSAANSAYKLLKHTSYVTNPNQYQVDVWMEDFTGLVYDDRLHGTGDTADVSRSGGTAFLGVNQTEFANRYVQANLEFQARAYYYMNLYRGTSAWRAGNYPTSDVEYAGDWAETDGYENDWTGGKGMGGFKGNLSHWYGVRPYQAPTIEPNIRQILAAQRSDIPGIMMWYCNVLDSCPATDLRTTTYADRARLGMGISCMFDNVFFYPRVGSDNNAAASDAATNSTCYATYNPLEWPFYWDETMVDVTTRAARGFSSYGNGVGRGWLGVPAGDMTWGWDRTAADTEFVSHDKITGRAGCVDTSFTTMTGWTCTPSFETWSSLGRIDTVSNVPGRLANTVLKVRRIATDHTNFFNVGLRMGTGKASWLDPSRQHSIRFWAKADSTTFITAGLRNPNGGGTYGDNNFATVWLDTTWREYEVQVGRWRSGKSGACTSSDSAQVAFYCADTTGTFYLDDVRLFNRAIGFMYRKFTNGVVFVNPDTGWVNGDSSGVTAWRAVNDKVINYQTVLGDTATYDYGLISGVGARRTLNNGRVFGYSGAAVDTLPAGNAKFVLRAVNGYWNGAPAAGGRQNRGPRMTRVTRTPGR